MEWTTCIITAGTENHARGWQKINVSQVSKNGTFCKPVGVAVFCRVLHRQRSRGKYLQLSLSLDGIFIFGVNSFSYQNSFRKLPFLQYYKKNQKNIAKYCKILQKVYII
jgi:hypothetical protein